VRVLLGVLIALVLVAPAEAGARDCHRSGKTVSANQSARLFSVGVSGDYQLYACWLPTGRVRALGALDLGETGPAAPTLAGRYVAYDRIFCLDSGDCSGRVVVRDVQTGERLHAAPAQPGIVKRIVLTTGGVAAWIRGGVYKLDATGVTALDGPVADQGSLALAGTTAYWMRGETPVSADLGGIAASAPGAKGRTKDCRIRGRTVTANARVRVFDIGTSRWHRYFACDVARVRAINLGDWAGEGDGVSPFFGLDGRALAYEEVHCDYKALTCSGHVSRLDVPTRRERREPYSGAPCSALALVGENVVRVVNKQLWVSDATTPLDIYPNVGDTSLAVAGDRIYWTSAGAPRTATP
jgi:hypothetical protein